MVITKKTAIAAVLICTFVQLFAFDSGFILGLRANLTGSLTDPKISKKDMDFLGGDKMKGTLGYVTVGEAELTYLFDSIRYFNYEDNAVFGGVGWAFNLGLGQGFSGQISGQYEQSLNDGKGKDVEVFCRIHMNPVLTLGSGVKVFLLKNRITCGLGLGLRMPLDPQPVYELYSNLTPEEEKQLQEQGFDLTSETGTLIISEDQMKKINPIGYLIKTSIEYNQPFINNMEIMVGAFLSYTIYKPKYITMPKKLINAIEKRNPEKDVKNTPLNSFYMNSFDFGISIGLNFKV